MAEKTGSEEPKKVPKGFEFHGNPWERRKHYRDEILKILVQNPEKSYNASELSETVECTHQTAQIILLEMALAKQVDVQETKSGYSKLYRINLEQIAKDVTQVKPKISSPSKKQEV